MSLSLTRNLSVAFCPDRIAVALTARGFYGRVLEDQAVIHTGEASGEINLSAGLVALDRWLEAKNLHHIPIHLTLEDTFARYLVVPWSAEIRGPQEVQMLAQACFESAYGASESWEIRVDERRFGKAALGCAIQKESLDAVVDLSRRYKLRLRSLQTTLVRALTFHRKRLADENCLILLPLGNQVVTISRYGACWFQAGTRRLTATNDVAALQALVQREIILQGLPEDSAIVIFCIDPSCWESFSGISNVTVLPVSVNQNQFSDELLLYPMNLALGGTS